jgi:hypothetical protein
MSRRTRSTEPPDTERFTVGTPPTADDDVDAAGIDIDLHWDLAEADGQTVRPPPDAASSAGADDPVDVGTALRAARTAAALGRTPPLPATKKMPPFELSSALARLTADEADGDD